MVFPKPEQVVNAQVKRKIEPFPSPKEIEDGHVKRAEKEGQKLKNFKVKLP
jgi:hypothetical protein